jgi:hypothetical protein
MEIDRQLSSDGKQGVTFYRTGDGLFTYKEEKLLVDQVPEVGEVPMFWETIQHGGLFLTEAEARAGAANEISWLRK